MGNTARGKHALFISDRSGLQYPYTEMVKEWNGARVHTSEYEPKQPQLEPKPYTADPQGLMHPRPARLEPPTPDFLVDNPITTGNGGTFTTYVINQPNSGIEINDAVRLMSIQQPLFSLTTALQRSIQELELSTTLATDINATTQTLTVTDDLGFISTGGFIMIEKINSTSGLYENEVIQYTTYNSGTKTLSGLVRGTNAPFRGETPANTIASAHSSGANIFGTRNVVSLNTTTSPSGGQPPTITNQNGYNLPATSPGTFLIDVYGPGGGNGCLAGPLNVNITDGRS
tara:strand:+ start:189 stop:1049 length:861 start_codon:yes stop_codon:yes gene_type:complete